MVDTGLKALDVYHRATPKVIKDFAHHHSLDHTRTLEVLAARTSWD